MNKISDITRQDIFDIIKDGFIHVFDKPEYDGDSGQFVYENKIYMPYYGRLDEIGFFSRLHDLEALPSYDKRYRDALGDIRCHLSWGDYEDYWFFQDRRFGLSPSDGDEPLLKFMCEILHPAVRKENSPWKQYLSKFNELLRTDGYELYAAQHISGRDIYKSREYYISDKPLFPDNLFSERYKELIDFGNGESVDNISGSVEYSAKKHICKIMFEFSEPVRIKRSRYDNWIDNTTALEMAINALHEHIGVPVIDLNPMFPSIPPEDLLANHFTPFVFDIIELQNGELSNGEKSPFQSEINASFQKNNVPFRLTDRGFIELLTDHEVLSSEIISQVESITEPGIKDLLNDAIEKHMQPNIKAHQYAVEKIWDALERLKTYYTDMDKKASVSKIVSDMANSRAEFIELFNAEFIALTNIGNKYRIRHHETDKFDITDNKHYDYFFNRCLSLIALAIQYIS